MKKVACSLVLAGGLFAAACSNSPGAPSVSFTSPVAAGPANGASYKFKAQPVTVTITNSVRTGSTTPTYAIEVASDPGFVNKVFSQDGIAEAAGGTTPVNLNALPAGSGNVTYYWRSWAVVEGVAGPTSTTQSFVVQQQIVINAPALSSPAAGGTVSALRPTFVTKNAARQGAVGTITYVFQVSTASDFSTLAASSPAITEQPGGQTSWTPSSDLPTGTLYWRAQAKDDSNSEASGFAGAKSFVVEPFDPTKAIFLNNFPDIGSWPQTATITSVVFEDGFMLVDFDKRQGHDKWPEAGFGSDSGLQYTLGLCFNINDQWYCSAPIQFWEGRDLAASGPADSIGDNWYYDPARWGPMAGHQPAYGERVAVWVGQGNLRGGGNTYRERSNFVVIPFGSDYYAN